MLTESLAQKVTELLKIHPNIVHVHPHAQPPTPTNTDFSSSQNGLSEVHKEGENSHISRRDEEKDSV